MMAGAVTVGLFLVDRRLGWIAGLRVLLRLVVTAQTTRLRPLLTARPAHA